MKCTWCGGKTKTLYVRDGHCQERRIAVIKHCYRCRRRVSYQPVSEPIRED